MTQTESEKCEKNKQEVTMVKNILLNPSSRFLVFFSSVPERLRSFESANDLLVAEILCTSFPPGCFLRDDQKRVPRAGMGTLTATAKVP